MSGSGVKSSAALGVAGLSAAAAAVPGPVGVACGVAAAWTVTAGAVWALSRAPEGLARLTGGGRQVPEFEGFRAVDVPAGIECPACGRPHRRDVVVGVRRNGSRACVEVGRGRQLQQDKGAAA